MGNRTSLNLTTSLTQIVTDEDLQNWRFVRDVRNYAASLDWDAGAALGNLFTEMARRIDECVDNEGIVQELDISALEAEVVDEYDDEAAEELEDAFAERFRLWWRDTFSEPCPPTHRPYARKEAWERWRAVATILRTMAGGAGKTWGQESSVEPRKDSRTRRHLAARGRTSLTDRDKKRRSRRTI